MQKYPAKKIILGIVLGILFLYVGIWEAYSTPANLFTPEYQSGILSMRIILAAILGIVAFGLLSDNFYISAYLVYFFYASLLITLFHTAYNPNPRIIHYNIAGAVNTQEHSISYKDPFTWGAQVDDDIKTTEEYIGDEIILEIVSNGVAITVTAQVDFSKKDCLFQEIIQTGYVDDLYFERFSKDKSREIESFITQKDTGGTTQAKYREIAIQRMIKYFDDHSCFIRMETN
jgi:hypothetical protein